MTNSWIIGASAGSGKTFQLSNRYLDILFFGDSVETILASTFTRKAAGEILDRVLQRLAAAALDEGKRQELRVFVDSCPGSMEDLRNILADLARNLYRIRISTLDSFFNKIATSFALEIGFPPGWSILDDNDYNRCLSEAIRLVLSESEKNNAKQLMDLLQKGEQDRNVMRELLDLASNLLPLVRETTPENWEHGHLARTELNSVQLRDLLDRLEKTSVPSTQQDRPDSRFVKLKENIAVLAMNEDWKKIAESSVIKSIAKNEDEIRYYTILVPDDLLLVLKEFVDQIRAVQINKLIAQTRATRQLLELIREACDEILIRERKFRFEDVTERLARKDFSPTLENLAHRMDARTQHLLLDEFQDTSMSQWKVLHPFALEATRSKDGSFFCVGDTKQAIYAWRGGVAAIFDSIEKQLDLTEPNRIPLNKSFRSSPVVIETVNRLFESIVSNPALDAYPSAVENWSQRFEHHVADKVDLPGFCRLEVAIPVENGEISNELADDETEASSVELQNDQLLFQYTIDRIVRLHREKPNASIGVLVMRNKQIGALIAGLKARGIEASEEGGNPLTDSAAVQHILSAMILADHPGDLIARFHLANGPLAKILELEEYRNDNADDTKALACSQKIRRDLLTNGYGKVVEKWIKHLLPSCNARERQRLEKLWEKAYRFQETVTGIRTRRFIEMVKTERVESPTAASIRVMTIHKSKGLEFDIVVLPDLDTRLVKKPPKVVVDREDATEPPRFVLRHVSAEIQNLLPVNYQKVFEQRIESEVEEQLSVLYVAMTRAVYELIMIVPPLSPAALTNFAAGKPSYSSSFAGILRAGLNNTQGEPDRTLLFHEGTSNWYKKSVLAKQPQKTASSNDEPEILDCELAGNNLVAARNIPRVSPSGQEVFADEMKTAEDKSVERSIVLSDKKTRSVGRTREDALLWGTAMHACFEHGLGSNPWLDQGLPDRTLLGDIVRNAVMGQKGIIDQEKLIQTFLDACEKPNIKASLSLANCQPSAGQTLEVEHERRFAVRLSDQQLLHGSVDRLIVRRENGQVVGIEIIDYKTDKPTDSSDIDLFVETRSQNYRPQLEMYREGIAKLYRIEKAEIKTKIKGKLLFVELDRVVEIH